MANINENEAVVLWDFVVVKKKRNNGAEPELDADPSRGRVVKDSSRNESFDHDEERNSVELFWNVEVPSEK